jgi:N-acylneuraminate cytidylyltransferase
MTNVAIIPARGGSKRIPHKNIKDFCGKPMIAWSLEAAITSGICDRVIVSTDDAEIAKVARSYGAETPFERPADLANDHADTDAVVSHATRWLLDQSVDLEAVCCLYATAPFVQAEDLRKARTLLASGEWDFTFTATEFPAPIFRSFKQNANGGIEMFWPEHYLTRSQDLPVALHDAGQFYWGRPAAWLEGRRVFDRRSLPVVIPRWRVQDIDNDADWVRAELMFRALQAMKNHRE